ncbi:MAG: EamA family transporter [Deltaproteobacteria bacterium]|nr:EamA family transporter [Deltaproteobacteria bacterium]
MKNLLFYLLVVLIWGSSWIGIKLQLGTVEPMASVTYRFGLASVILLIWCRIRGLNMRFSLQEHGFMLLQGVLLFCLNYILFYIAELHVTSGLAAVIFSTILLMNMVNGAIFLGSAIDRMVVIGGLLGLVGIALVFRQEITSFSLENRGALGAVLCVTATLFASFGNITSARNQKHGLPIVQTNAYGMGYGALVMLLMTVALGKSLNFDPSPVYIGSLLYLSLFASVIAFGCYLTLIGNIGADRAAYVTLLFPIVALLISTIWEDYRWTVSSAAGVGLILLGNLWMLKRKTSKSHH